MLTRKNEKKPCRTNFADLKANIAIGSTVPSMK